jgi:metal-responsive CopG/Arc/MetJ family transcriptional regulator
MKERIQDTRFQMLIAKKLLRKIDKAIKEQAISRAEFIRRAIVEKLGRK